MRIDYLTYAVVLGVGLLVTGTMLASFTTQEPDAPIQVYEAAVALEVVSSRRSAVAQIRGMAAEVIDAHPDRLAAACVTSSSPA